METAEETLAADFTVNVYNLDSLGRLSVRSLADFLFEAASRHARRLGVDVPDLEPLGLTWMLSRLRFAVERLPGWGRRCG